MGTWIDEGASGIAGYFRPALMVELWMALLWYGGGWLSDVELLGYRSARRIFGWERVPHPTTVGRWLRRAGGSLAEVLDEQIRELVALRWSRVGVRTSVTVVVDGTVCVRYGEQQDGAETGCTPHKPGRPSHRPLLAYVVETADLLGVLWRPGSSGAATGVPEWLPGLVAFLREQGGRGDHRPPRPGVPVEGAGGPARGARRPLLPQDPEPLVGAAGAVRSLRYAQPRTLRTRLFGGPAKFTDTGGQTEFQLPAERWEDSLLFRLLEGLNDERGPPANRPWRRPRRSRTGECPEGAELTGGEVTGRTPPLTSYFT